MSDKLQLVGKRDLALTAMSIKVGVDENVSDLADEMFRIMDREKGVGLAAPQLGINTRLIVVGYGATQTEMINPVIVKSPGKIVTSLNEGCLSYPGKRVNIKRSKRVIVEYCDRDWNKQTIDARNFLAFVLQHEIDHLNGITIGDL